MIWCDHAFKSRLSHSGFLVRLSKCYVDDINLAADEVHLSTRYEKGKLVVKEEAVDEDSLITSNKKTMEVVRKTGNSIHLLIQLEVYYPSNHEDFSPESVSPGHRMMVYIDLHTNFNAKDVSSTCHVCQVSVILETKTDSFDSRIT